MKYAWHIGKDASSIIPSAIQRQSAPLQYLPVNVGRRCGVVDSTLAFGSIGHGFESEHSLFSHNSASAFSKLTSLAKCSLDDSVRRLL